MRAVPAQFGVPWHDPIHLSVSFAPDGTDVAGHASSLFQTLDAQMPQAQWEALILQAFQTWAVQADINFALTSDGGQPFGTPGPDQHDPRFGDIRIGAQPMPSDVLAISVPHDPFLSGTWSGDILLNSNVVFDGRNASLLPVLLHEVGHVLGLQESSDPNSVMFANLNPQNTSLSTEDIAAVQALYGPRPPDTFAGPPGAGVIQATTPFPAPQGYDGTTPLFLYADIAFNRDSDVFSLRAPAGYNGPVTFRLQSAGVSLLAPHLTVYDAAGLVVGDVASTALGGDTLLVTLSSTAPGATYYVQVRGATSGPFGVGEYALAVSFDARSTVSPSAIDTLARQSYAYLSPDDLNAIFLDPLHALFAVDHHSNDTFATAEPLSPANAVYGSEAPIRTIASLSDPTDVHFFRFETPDEPSGDGSSDVPAEPLVMTVTVRATEVNGIMPTVSVFDARHAPVRAQVLAHGDGTYTIQVAGAWPDATYYVRVAADPTAGKSVGNYDLDVEYGHVVAAPATFVAATASPASSATKFVLVVNQPQLFEFLLAAPGTTAPGSAVTLTITDAAGNAVFARTAIDGVTAGGDPVLLVPGVYRAAFTAQGGFAQPLSFRLYGASLTDPIGPELDDPTLAPFANPSSIGPAAAVPPGIASTDQPYLWLAATLAAPAAGPSTATPGANPQFAQLDGPATIGAIGSIALPLNTVAASLSGNSLVAAGGMLASAQSTAVAGRGPVAAATIGTAASVPGASSDETFGAAPGPSVGALGSPSPPPQPVPAGNMAADGARLTSIVRAISVALPVGHGPEAPFTDATPPPQSASAADRHVTLAAGSLDPSPAEPESAATDLLQESTANLVVSIILLAYGGWFCRHHVRSEGRVRALYART